MKDCKFKPEAKNTQNPLLRKMYPFILGLSCIAFLLSSNIGYAGLTIEYSSTEESERTGFYDDSSVGATALGDNSATSVGEARRNVLEAAAAYWDGILQVDSDVSIYVQFSALTCGATSYVVGSTTSYADDLENVAYPRAFYLNETGSSGRAMSLQFNSSIGKNFSTACQNASWYYGLDENTPASNYIDLYYTAKHEIAHGLGIKAIGVNLSSGVLTSSSGGAFINNLLDLTTGKFWNDATMTDTERNTSKKNGSNDLVWGGEEVNRVKNSTSLLTDGVNSGYPIIYAPSTYAAGSSVSHFDTSITYDSVAAGTNELMEPVITDSEDAILTVAALTDIGWTVLLDSDGDGTTNPDDAFPLAEAADADTDGDGFPDDWLATCDASCQAASGFTIDDDDDGDTILDINDNCPLISNADQADLDGDDSGDVCDDDGDDDGILNTDDLCPLGETGWTSTAANDVDGDGCRDSSEDFDSDNDGVDDADDSDPDNPNVCSDIDNDGYDDCRTGTFDTTLDSDIDGDGFDYDVDVDNDGDGLIEIFTLAQLDEMRDDLAGTTRNGDNTGCYAGCYGYELMNDLDFDTDSSGSIGSSDEYWNGGKGWEPIGSSATPFTGIFDGNGFRIINLYIDRDDSDSNYIGLFGFLDGAEVRNIGLTGTASLVAADYSDYVGTLIGYSYNATVSSAFSTIDISHTNFGEAIGGLIGFVSGGSVSNVFTSGNILSAIDNWHYIGGIVGENTGTINNSYSIATVLANPEDTPNKGAALIGLNSGTYSDLYWNSGLTPLSAVNSDSNPGTASGLSTTDMKCPQSPADSGCNITTAYQNWSDTDWDFGTSSEYPALIINGTVYREVDASPVVTAPGDKTVEATGFLTAVELGDATAVDEVDGTLTATADDYGPFAVGTHTITWSATDSSGNTGTDTQTVTVNDTTDPTVTAPGDKTVEASGASTTVSLGSGSATDLVDGTLTATADQSGPFAVGTHTITWSATDSSGNTGTDTQTITVSDTTAPTVTAPADQTVEASGASTTVSLGSGSATDLVDGTLTATADQSGPFGVGTHTITWSATDSSGNTGTDTQTITVSDTTAPTVTAPADQTVEATGPSTTVSLGSGSATDLVDGTLTATADQSGPFGVGTHTITWSATDSSGNTGTDSQTITVSDTTAPTVTAPADQTVEATGATTSVSLGSGSATDLVDGTLTATADNSGPFGIGTHTITWSATDSSGNTGTDTQTITVTDTTAPTVTAPADQTVTTTGTLTAVELGSASANDLVDGTLTATADDYGPFELGTHTITWSATDNSGNTGTATQTISIVENTPPTFTGTPAITGSPKVDSTLSLTDSDTDDVDGDTVTLGYQWHADGEDITGETSATYTVTSDDIGKTISCTVTADDGMGGATSFTTSGVVIVQFPWNLFLPAIIGSNNQ